MSDPNLNALWCRCIGEELVRAGVREVVVCPGNRNVPLAFAFDRLDGLRVISHVEERSGAFLALGLAQAARRPVAVCTTSGSAVANCLPALAEAVHDHLPLLVIGADRPPWLHGCEAPQTMRQAGLFAPLGLAECELELPAADTGALMELRSQLHAWAHRCAGPGGGPGYCNVPLDDPLPPLPDPAFEPPSDEGNLPRPARAAQITGSQPTLERAELSACRPGLKGLIVAGPRCPLPVDRVAALAERSGFPVLADAASNLRTTDVSNLVVTADALCAGALGRSAPDLLIRLGPAPVARSVYEYCQRHRGAVLRVDAHRVERDFCHRSFELMVRPSEGELAKLAAALEPGDADWTARWLEADEAARAARSRWLASAPWGEHLAAATACACDAFELVQLANSLAVRHANLHLAPDDGRRRVVAHRGLNGIDGTLGSFLGALHALPDRPGLLLCGDLAFLHDLPALTAGGRPHLNGTVCVIDNGGGGIFDLLPVSGLQGYQRLIRTPREVDVVAVATGLGCRASRVDAPEALTQALQEAAQRPGLDVVVAVVPGGSLAEPHAELIGRMAGRSAG